MVGDNNKMKYYPFECSVNTCVSCSEFVCDGVSNSGLINDKNCMCCPLLCGIFMVFDIFTCIPFSVYSSYKKCTNCNCKKNKITIVTAATTATAATAATASMFVVNNQPTYDDYKYRHYDNTIIQ